MTAKKAGRLAIRGINSIVNLIVLAVIMLLVAYAGYALWDSEQIYRAADRANYAIYKPTVENEGISFQELQTLNAEVFAWLSVYGTNIDYPVTQGPDNMKYVNTNAEGRYSLSGAIFLDYRNSKDFSDFNSVIYGHHMARNAMFGQIGQFSNELVFESNKYGYLYYNGQEFGIEFFAFIHTHSSDETVFRANITGEVERQSMLDDLLANATFKRDIGVTTEDRIILLTTCSSDSTNGRDVLIGRLSDEVYDDPFTSVSVSEAREQAQVDSNASREEMTRLLRILVPVLIIAVALTLLILITSSISNKRRKRLIDTGEEAERNVEQRRIENMRYLVYDNATAAKAEGAVIMAAALYEIYIDAPANEHSRTQAMKALLECYVFMERDVEAKILAGKLLERLDSAEARILRDYFDL